MTKNFLYNNIMNPENPNSPFFNGNTLKQGIISKNNNCASNYAIHTEDFSHNLATGNLIDPSCNYNSIDTCNNVIDRAVCSSVYIDIPSSYDYNKEFDSNYSYNNYESYDFSYNPYNNSIYDNFNSGLYDLYQNNTFNDDTSYADMYNSDNDYF